ncbi:MAG: flavodoxin [Eubacteriaceae bacterium]|nr:flavodoxin [Eubacteriaceae bacterium]
MPDKKIVVYYSLSSNTKKLAEAISEKTGASIFEIETVEAYPTEQQALIAAVREAKEAGKLPELKAMPDLSEYDQIFIGSPNWGSTIAPAMEAFIRANDFSGKSIAPFLTYGGGGLGKSEADLAEWAKGADIKPFFSVSGAGDESTSANVDKWLSDNSL